MTPITAIYKSKDLLRFIHHFYDAIDVGLNAATEKVS